MFEQSEIHFLKWGRKKKNILSIYIKEVMLVLESFANFIIEEVILAYTIS